LDRGWKGLGWRRSERAVDEMGAELVEAWGGKSDGA
jgi:hypothetical protein